MRTPSTTARPTQPLRDEHRELLPHVEGLRALGDAADAPPAGWMPLLDGAVAFLRDHLLVHAGAEERALYPVVAELMGAPEATATMSRDHEEVQRLVGELAGLRDALREHAPAADELRNLRRLAYGLYTLVEVHFAKEEEIYLPLLDARLTPERAAALFASMEQAADDARAAR